MERDIKEPEHNEDTIGTYDKGDHALQILGNKAKQDRFKIERDSVGAKYTKMEHSVYFLENHVFVGQVPKFEHDCQSRKRQN